MTWTLVTSGKASIFSLPKVKMPKTTKPAVATRVRTRRWTAISMSRSSMLAPPRVLSNPRAVLTSQKYRLPHDGGLKFSFRQPERNLSVGVAARALAAHNP